MAPKVVALDTKADSRAAPSLKRDGARRNRLAAPEPGQVLVQPAGRGGRPVWVVRPRSNDPGEPAKRTARATIGRTLEAVTPMERRNCFVNAGHGPCQLHPASGPRDAVARGLP